MLKALQQVVAATTGNRGSWPAFAPVAQAENAVVGTGTAASCTAASYNAALSLVVNDVQGGVLTFNCGPNPHTININGARVLQNFVVIDGGGRITLDALDASRFFVVNQDGPDGQTRRCDLQRG